MYRFDTTVHKPAQSVVSRVLDVYNSALNNSVKRAKIIQEMEQDADLHPLRMKEAELINYNKELGNTLLDKTLDDRIEQTKLSTDGLQLSNAENKLDYDFQRKFMAESSVWGTIGSTPFRQFDNFQQTQQQSTTSIEEEEDLLLVDPIKEGEPISESATSARAASLVSEPESLSNVEVRDQTQLWRGFNKDSANALYETLPKQAKHLAKSFIEAGEKYDIDPAFLAAISAHETGNWTSNAFKNKNNAMGISNKNGVVSQASVEESIRKMAASLAGAPGTAGHYKNANTIEEVAEIYAPQGASNDPKGLNKYWAKNVSKLYQNLKGYGFQV